MGKTAKQDQSGNKPAVQGQQEMEQDQQEVGMDMAGAELGNDPDDLPPRAEPGDYKDYSAQDRHTLEEYERSLSEHTLSVHGVQQAREDWAKEAMRRVAEINDPNNLRQRQLIMQIGAMIKGWNITDMEMLDRFVEIVEEAPDQERREGLRLLNNLMQVQIRTEADRSEVFSQMSEYIAERAVSETDERNRERLVALGGRMLQQQNRRAQWCEFPEDANLVQQAEEEHRFGRIEMWENPEELQQEDDQVIRRQLREYNRQARRRDEKDLKDAREKGTYVLPKMTNEELQKWNKDGARKLFGVNVGGRAAATFVMGEDVYEKTDQKYQGTEEERTVNIHHSLGTKYNKAKSHVLQIDIGGSGYIAPTREHHGISAWAGLSDTQVGEGEGMENEAMLTAEYGERTPVRGHEEKTEIRSKSSLMTLQDGTVVRKDRYSIPGPTGWRSLKGTRNSGDYSIENTRQVVCRIGEDFLTPIFEKWEKHPEEIADVHINITGHSRGGCGAGEGTDLLRNWLLNNERFNKYADRIVIDTIQMDPVPGYGNRTSHGKLNYSTPAEEGKKQPRINGTVIYTMAADHADNLFRPQDVQGAERLIFGMTTHAVGLNVVDRSQMAVEKDGQAHRRGFYDMETGEFYRGSGISELPEGVYFSDDKQNLVRINSMSQLNEIMDVVSAGAEHSLTRQNVLRSAVKSWFAEHEIRSGYRNPEERERVQQQAVQAEEKLLYGAVAGDGLDAVREGVRTLRIAREGDDAAAIRNAEDALVRNCREYFRNVEVNAEDLPFRVRRNMDLVGDLMSGVQRERNFQNANSRYTERNEPLSENVREQRVQQDAESADRMRAMITQRVNQMSEKLEAQERRYSPAQRNSPEYVRMRDALRECAALSEGNSVREIMGVVSELSSAADGYLKARSAYDPTKFGQWMSNKFRYAFSRATRQRVGFAEDIKKTAESLTMDILNDFGAIYDKNSPLQDIAAKQKAKLAEEGYAAGERMQEPAVSKGERKKTDFNELVEEGKKHDVKKTGHMERHNEKSIEKNIEKNTDKNIHI